MASIASIAILFATSIARADSLSLVTSAAGLNANDSVQWSQLGGNGLALPATFSANSAAQTVTVNLNGPNSLLSIVCASSSCSWVGPGFPAGDTLIWTSDGQNGGNGPITLNLGSRVAGVGGLIQADGPSQFTAQIQAYNGATSPGTFTETSDAIGDAIYIGVMDNSGANITSVVLSLTSSKGATSDFAIDSLNLSGGKSATPTPTIPAPTATPTPFVNPTGTPIPTQTPTPASTPAAIALVATTRTGSITQSVPAGVQNGDLLLAFYSYWSNATASSPVGWHLLNSSTASGSGVETVWYRFANNDAPGATYNWAFGGAKPYEAGGMIAYRGVDPASLEDGSCTNQARSTAPSLCSFNTTYTGDIYVGFFAVENTGLSLPSDLAGRVVTQYAGGVNFGVAAADKALGPAGTVAAETGSMNNGGWATIALALKPLNASGPTPTPTPVGITYVGTSNTGSTIQTVPQSVQNGDLLLAFYSYWSNATATAPNGWHLLNFATESGSGVEAVWYRFASNDAPGSTYTWSFAGATPYESGGMLAYRGVDSSALEDNYCTNQGRGTAPILCSFTTADSSDVYVGFFAVENTNLSLPNDLSARVLNQYAPGINFGVAAADKTLGSAGTAAAETASMNSGGWATIAVALKALNSSTPSPTPTPTGITYVGSSNTGGTSQTVPASVQNGDLLLAFYSYWSYATATAPTGWHLLNSATKNGSGAETVWYRFANNDVPGSTYIWSFSGATPYEAGGVTAYRGVDPSALEDNFCTNQGSSSQPALCSFATTHSGDLYVGFFSTENTGLVLPADLTSRVLNQYSPGINFGVAEGDKALGSAGTIAADTGSMNSAGWATVAVALKALNSPLTTRPPRHTSSWGASRVGRTVYARRRGPR
jgi:hypothetical protein